MPDGRFDCAIAAGSFEFIKDLSPVLTEIRRVLKPGGGLIFTCFNKNSLFHVLPRRDMIQAYFLSDIRRILEKNGFHLKEARSSFFIPFQIVWGVYSILTFGWIRDVWLRAIIFIEKGFLKPHFLKHKGMQFIISCEKAERDAF